MDTFKIKIVASNKVFYDGEAQSLSVPYIDGGSFTFLAHHCNAVVPIEAGEMRLKTADGEVKEAFVSDGFLEFLSNEATMICVSVELPEEIDKRRAEEAKEPYNINHIKDIVLFALIGIVFSMAYILIANLLDTTIKDQENVERATDLLVLAQIPEISFEMKKIGGRK